ncbi:uncharacterized protein F4807DRAFT_438764 [Annulohypoxylon truncatum]|uniref:uncharacterized protein n=1 Tax=Annulohypoxylon truncatum TaxID=327061 RepID=UPI0020086DDC|nr:uncharacterized protein F4807DRAFT_438764 [Annulohypoxylon truncatum]KAI1206640.1 hypothetical protein F4807DRAFT_438764 [Annulohypoxylon truncatum]
MPSHDPNNAPPAPHASVPASRVLPSDIERVDAFARKLYKRARAAGPDLDEISTAVRSLHTVLKHLKFETEDPESLLCADGSGVYARQLTPILEDSEFALKQLDTILEKKYGGGDGGMQMDGEKGWTILESREKDMIGMIRSKLANQKLNIDMFLDTIQLHNPSKSRRMVDTNSADLDSIKDKVDVIATRICQRKNSNLADENEEELWERFRDGLESAGFSREVLRKNQDVIRAYIRQLDEQLSANGGSTPSVRGLLEHYRPQAHDGLQIAPYPTCPTYPTSDEFSPEELQSGIDEEKLFPSMRMKRLEGEDDDNQRIQPPRMSNHPTYLSYDRHSSSGDDEDSMALMSTRELMALDKRAAELALTKPPGNMHLQPPRQSGELVGPNYHMSTSPTQHQLPPSASRPALPSSTIAHNGVVIDQSVVPSRHVPPPGSSPEQQQAVAALQQRSAHLAPDSQGREIPLEAKWTRISRRLVSPEVLAGAGVRYEARPDFVAVLGELSRDQVADFARRTTEARNSRRRRSSAAAIPVATVAAGSGGGGRRAENKYHPDKYRNWDVIEEERRRPGRKGADRDGSDDDDDDSATYVVNSRGRHRKGSTASSASALYDSSDDEGTSDSEVDYGDRDRDHYDSSSYSQSYPRSSSYLENYHGSQQSLRRSSTAPSTSFNDDGRVHSHARGSIDSNATTRRGSGDTNDKGTKTYPFIVPPPSTNGKDKTKDKDSGAGTSPAATVKPKSILKNKNDDPHVRIDPNPQFIDESSRSLSRSLPYRRSERERRERDKDRDRERSRDRSRERTREKDRDRDRDRNYDHDHDREKKYRSDRYQDRDQSKERHSERHRDKEYYSSHRDRDRDDGKEEYADRHRHRSSSHRYHGGGSSSTASRRNRDRDYHDDHYTTNSGRSSKEDRTSKKKARDETIRAVGLGGAAAAMLSMLSEAAL